ncbi:MAG: hypothetical protein IT328_16180 [Caldilineaceae bacterium]|nr:hypothetical protein [Caldilineaceae bacterium]
MRLSSKRWLIRRGAVLLVALLLLGGSSIPAGLARYRSFSLAIAGYEWDIVGWEAQAIWEKVNAAIAQPAGDLPPAVATMGVQEYLARAARMGEIERELARRASIAPGELSVPSDAELLLELADVRAQQEAVRPQIEQVIERQVNSELEMDGFVGIGQRVWPPVSFTFVEPPKKLVVSRRDRIETIYSQMLEAAITLDEIEQTEGEIRQQYNAVGYITDIGGLGAFPTMVVDRASLRWVLSTVAHEWTHNYLVFYPLGWNYFTSQDLTTMNETVAEIVGNEVGDQTLARYYPELVPPLQPEPVAPPAMTEPLPFDFQIEMRQTRLEVDRLLAEGDVAGAEAYMEERRLDFVANGYPLRVLNQAYFAFHGSYGTSPASTSPIGPNLARLRELMPDLKTFLETVRGFTSVEELNQTLLLWERSAGRVEAAAGTYASR